MTIQNNPALATISGLGALTNVGTFLQQRGDQHLVERRAVSVLAERVESVVGRGLDRHVDHSQQQDLLAELCRFGVPVMR